MGLQGLLLELLISGFFAIACFKARAARQPGELAMSPRDFLRLTDRLDRLSRTRYQWIAMAAILLLVRLQTPVPLLVEVTAAVQFIVFLALPVGDVEKKLSAGTRERAAGKSERAVKAAGRSGKARRQERTALASAQR